MNAMFRIFLAGLMFAGGLSLPVAAAADAKKKSTATAAGFNKLKELYGTANNGDVLAQFQLGAAYDAGLEGLPERPDQAEIWYQRAAAQGHAASQNALGTLYNTEKLGKPDHAKAFQWFRRAADQGLPLAEYNLGYLYYSGKGVEQDHREALRWFGKAGAKGFAIAQFTVGRMLYEGAGLVNKNLPEAFRWFELAAYQDNSEAQYYCGVMLFQGQGVEQDYVTSCAWLLRAADRKVPRAGAARDIVQQILDGKQALEAMDKAAKFTVREASESTIEEPNLDSLAPMLAGSSRPRTQATIPHMSPAPPKARPQPPSLPSIAEIPQTAKSPTPTSSSSIPRTGVAPLTTPQPTSQTAMRTERAAPATSLPRVSAAPTAPEVSTPLPKVNAATTAASAPTRPAPSPPPAPAAVPAPATGTMLPPVHERAPVQLVKLKVKAEDGDANSQFQMGRVFAQGEDVNQNFREAVRWHTLAAQQGHAGAQTTLGTMHFWGRGVTRDVQRAAQWLMLAAERGSADAQYWLAVIYERNPTERLKWFQASAEHGSKIAQFRLAELYLTGAVDGGSVGHIEAYKWLELAANQGNKEAAALRESLAGVMTKREVKDAKDRALKFIPKRPMAPIGR